MRFPLTRSTVSWLLLSCVATLLIAWRSTGFPNLFLEDDAYFYLQIAWNIGTGHGSSFDGLTVTNGYHLLWTGLLSALSRIVVSLGFGKPAFVFVVSVAGIGLATASAITALRSTTERILLVLLVLFCGVTMEGTLVAALCLVTMRAFLDEDVRLNATMAAAFFLPLARIDYAWVAPALAVISLGDRPRMQRLPLVPVVAAAALGAAAHFAVERTMFGTWTTVSSAYKADLFAARGASLLLGNVTNRANQLRYAVAAICAAAAATAGSKTGRVRMLLAIAIALAPIVVYSVVSAIRDWYFIPGLAMLLLLASRARGASRPWQFAATAQAAVIALACGAYLWQAEADWQRTSAFVRAANAALADTDVIYQVDGSGFTAWRLRAHVVNGDGLVNTWSYRERRRADALRGYLQEVGATHVLVSGDAEDGPVLDYHGLVVRPDEATLVADTGPTRNGRVHFRLFRLE